MMFSESKASPIEGFHGVFEIRPISTRLCRQGNQDVNESKSTPIQERTPDQLQDAKSPRLPTLSYLTRARASAMIDVAHTHQCRARESPGKSSTGTLSGLE
ncbi:hypothetical protein MN608_07706 [Microdochium nivale]|nr:hypothetical protein MN608_07706 [Microdochium nivale]